MRQANLSWSSWARICARLTDVLEEVLFSRQPFLCAFSKCNSSVGYTCQEVRISPNQTRRNQTPKDNPSSVCGCGCPGIGHRIRLPRIAGRPVARRPGRDSIRALPRKMRPAQAPTPDGPPSVCGSIAPRPCCRAPVVIGPVASDFSTVVACWLKGQNSGRDIAVPKAGRRRLRGSRRLPPIRSICR
jgi:hypothetical protein